MIVSKPKPNALIALGLFIVLNLVAGVYALNTLFNNDGHWYHYAMTAVNLPLGIMLLIRQLITYKVISIGDNRLSVMYPLRGAQQHFNLMELVSWKEEIIKTKNAPFRQLEIQFDNFLLKLTIQENTHYEQILKYLKKRAGKKEIK